MTFRSIKRWSESIKEWPLNVSKYDHWMYQSMLWRYQSMVHRLFGLGLGWGHKTARMASSKTFFNPFWVKAEHSRYLTEAISFAIASPCGYVIGWSFLSFNLSSVFTSSLRSSFVPTSIIGVFGQWCDTSGYHFALTFSNDAGLTSEKQIKNTSVWGYDRGRNLS